MTAQEYLKQAYKLNERIKDKEERIADLKELSTSTGAIDYAKDRVQSSPSADAPYTKQVMQIVELEQELEADKNRLIQLKIEINNAIESVKDVDQALLLSKRFVLMKKWEQIADEMGYSIRQLNRIKDKAFENFVVPKSSHVMS